jgi:uncharacterized protein
MSTLHVVTAFDTTATVDREARTIEGLAVPYGITARPGGSLRRPVEFARGSFDRTLKARADKVRLIVEHDQSRPVGKLIAYEDTAEGLLTTWRIASTSAGDQILAEAGEGIRDGLSVGADVIARTEHPDRVLITEAKLVEVSVVAFPAFDSARVSRVAAQDQHLTGRDPRALRLRLILENQ